MSRVPEPWGWCGRFVRRLFALTVIGTVAVALAVRWEAGREGQETVFAVSQETAELVSISLPVQVNDRVEAWMDRFLGDQRPMFERYLAREGLYGSMILLGFARDPYRRDRRLISGEAKKDLRKCDGS